MLPTVSGSIGEHLGIALFLSWLEGWPKDAQLELFRVDRGADLGLDLIVRLSSAAGARAAHSVSIGVQVKSSLKGKIDLRKADQKRLRSFVSNYPGPTIILKTSPSPPPYVVKLKDYRLWLADRRRNKWLSCSNKEAFQQEVGKLTCNYLRENSGVEARLAEDDPEGAQQSLATFDWISGRKQRPADLMLLRNRIEIRIARRERLRRYSYSSLLDRLSSAAQKRNDLLDGRPSKGGNRCPQYDGYCIHYQSALVRDEATRAKVWNARGYKGRRGQLEIAFASTVERATQHSVRCKQRLARLGFGILAVTIVNDVLDGKPDLPATKRRWGEMRSALHVYRGLRPEKEHLGKLGKLFEAFVKQALSDEPKPEPVRSLVRKLGHADPDEHVVGHLLLSVLHILRGDRSRRDFKAAHVSALQGHAIAVTIEKDLWLSPINRALGVSAKRSR